MPLALYDNNTPLTPVRSLFNTIITYFNAKVTDNVADLDALALLPATSEGQTAHVDELNCDFQARDGVWVQVGVSGTFANAGARDTAYAKGAGAYKVVGAQSQLATDLWPRRFVTGTTWRPLLATGLVPLKPVPGGTNVVVSAGGKVTIASAGGSTLDLRTVFTDDFSSYRIMLPRLLASGTAVLQARLLSGSTPLSSSTYDYDLSYRVGSTATAVASSAQNAINLSGASQQPVKFGYIDIHNPFKALSTGFEWRLGESPVAGGGIGKTEGDAYQNGTTSYDGLQLILSAGTFSTAEIQVFGYNAND
jgi:hypothetical protein